MTKILSIILLILLVNCTTTNTSNNSEKPKSSIDTVIDAFKSIPFPKM
jgi:ABC-type methionine transport system permease subunit